MSVTKSLLRKNLRKIFFSVEINDELAKDGNKLSAACSCSSGVVGAREIHLDVRKIQFSQVLTRCKTVSTVGTWSAW